MDYKNNIVVDTLGFPFSSATPPALGNNLLYSTVGTSLPSWYSILNGDINSNPLFTNASTYDFTLQSGSPAVGAGSALSVIDDIFVSDLFSALRGDPVDMGAIQYGSDPPTYDPPTVNAGDDQTVYAATADISGTYTVDSGLTATAIWEHGSYSGFCTLIGGVLAGTVTNLAMGANTITVTITDSESQEDSDTVIITRASLIEVSGRVTSTAVSYGVVRH